VLALQDDAAGRTYFQNTDADKRRRLNEFKSGPVFHEMRHRAARRAELVAVKSAPDSMLDSTGYINEVWGG
jgi:hypothetical protein